MQKKRIKQYEQQAEITRQKIDIMRSKNIEEILKINATAKAEAYKLEQQGVSQALENKIAAESEAY